MISACRGLNGLARGLAVEVNRQKSPNLAKSLPERSGYGVLSVGCISPRGGFAIGAW